MPTLAKKIFLSSTFIDLKNYREAAVQACQRVGLIPVYMESFPPDPRDAVAVCKSTVEEADLFLGLYAHRYGYVPDGYEVSVTEMEYDWAIERGLPVYLFVIDPDYPWPPSKVDKGADYERLERFKARIGKRHVLRGLLDAQTFKEDILVLGPELARAEPKTPTIGVDSRNVRKPIKVLLLQANPENQALLSLDKEVREIQTALSRATERFLVNACVALRVMDVQHAMLEFQPQIVHFFGPANGVILEDENGLSYPVSNSALANLFMLFANQVECVVLNGCYSETQAKAISEHIRYVIGMKAQISDRSAIAFAVGFYGALGEGASVDLAYRYGCVALELENLPDHPIPVLLVN